MSTSGCATRAVAEILRKGGIVPLHTGGGRCVAIGNSGVHYIKPALPLVQPQLKVGVTRVRTEIDCAPFDVEDTVGRGARNRGVNSTTAVGVAGATPARHLIGAQVIPIRQHGIVVCTPWQAKVTPGVIAGGKLGSAIR